MKINVFVLNPEKFEKEWTKGFRAKCRQEKNYDPVDLKLKLYGTWGYVKTNHGLYVLNRAGLGLPVPVSNRVVSSEPGQMFSLYASLDGVPQLDNMLFCAITLSTIRMMKIEEVIPLDDFILKLLPSSRESLAMWKDIFTQAQDFDIHRELADNFIEDEGPPDGGPEEDTEDVLDDDSDFEVDEVDEMEPLESSEREQSSPAEESWNEVLEDKKVSDATLDTKKLVCKIINTIEDVKKFSTFLLSDKCDCKSPEVLCCVKKDICSCGNKKSHYHCSKCGKITK